MATAQQVIQMMTEAQLMVASGNRAGADAAAAAAAQAASQLGNVQLHAAVVNHANSWGPTGGGGGNPGGGNPGGGNPGGPSGPSAADIQRMIREEAERAAAAERERRRSNVFDEARAMLRSWGVDMDGSLTNTIRDWVWQDKSNDYILMEFRKTDAYNRRFTGMADLVGRGQFMNEAEYIAQERAYRNTMQQWDLPEGFYDSYDDFGRFIANGVSVKELDDRIQTAKAILNEDSPDEYKSALQRLYGVAEGDMLAYVIDGDKAQSLIEKRLKKVTFAGAASMGDFNLSDAELDPYVGTLGQDWNVVDAEKRAGLEKTMKELGTVADNQARLAGIDRDEDFKRSDILDSEILADQDKKLASQRRAQRERNRFAGSSAFTQSSFRRD